MTADSVKFGQGNNATPPDGTAVETVLIGGLFKRQVLTLSPRDGTEVDSIGGLTEAAPATDTASSGLNGRLQRIAQRMTSLIGVFPAALGSGGGLKIDGSGVALPISIIGTPLYDATAGAAAGLAVALPAVAGKTTYLSGFSIFGFGATGASGIFASLTNLDAVKISYFPFAIPAGVANAIIPVQFNCNRPIPAYQQNQSINLSIPSFGAGNTLAAATIWGFYL